MLKTVMRFTAALGIWCVGCAVADYLLPTNLARCWVMLWGCAIFGVQIAAVRLIH